MSTKTHILTVGLTALGFLGNAASFAAGPDAPPAAPGLPVASAPHADAPATAPPLTVLLLSRGRVLKGAVTLEGDRYLIQTAGGPLRYPREQVEGAFPSLHAAYLHQLEQIPDNDPDEHLKLGRWCLAQHLADEARAELQIVVKLSPASREARAMLASLEASALRVASATKRDSGLVQTRAEVVDPADRGARPAEMDIAVINRASREMGVGGLPVIFDLPQPVAVKRANEFSRNVHVVLQNACARCHNESHDGKFQLIQVKTRRDLTADVLRANLDATLAIIDPANPPRSEILSAALIPHGLGPKKRPIFRGSNDPYFQILSAWVNSLKSPSAARANPGDGVVQTRFAPGAREEGPSGFGSERNPSGPAAASAAVVQAPNAPKQYSATELPPPEVIPSTRFTPGASGHRGVIEDQPPSPEAFPVPFSAGGPAPRRTPGLPAPGAAPPASPRDVSEGVMGDPREASLPGNSPGPNNPAAMPPLPTAGPKDPAAAPAKPRKPVKIDPAVLEKALQLRNGSRG